MYEPMNTLFRSPEGTSPPAAPRKKPCTAAPEIHVLRAALDAGESIVTTGFMLQELLQGFSGPKARKELLDRFSALPILVPDRKDPVDAAELQP